MGCVGRECVERVWVLWGVARQLNIPCGTVFHSDDGSRPRWWCKGLGGWFGWVSDWVNGLAHRIQCCLVVCTNSTHLHAKYERRGASRSGVGIMG